MDFHKKTVGREKFQMTKPLTDDKRSPTAKDTKL